MRVLITGAARRIGRMLAERLAAQGHKIAIHYNSSDIEALQLLAQLGGKEQGHIAIQCDLNDLDQTANLLNDLQGWGKPSILINNASTFFRRELENFSNEDRRKQMTQNTNIFRVLIKTLLKAGIITERTRHVYQAWVDMDELAGEDDEVAGADVAAAAMEELKSINSSRQKMGARFRAN